MSLDDFKQIRVTDRDDLVLIEMLCNDVQGPDRATQFSAELTSVANQNSTKPILLDLGGCGYFSSMGYSALFKLVKTAKERQRPVMFCNMHPDVKSGADAVGLYHVVEVHDCQDSALAAFAER